MPFLRRREKPLHEQLAEGTDLLEWRSKHAPVYPPSFAGTLDVLHGGKPRRWDAVGTAEAPGLPGDDTRVHGASRRDVPGRGRARGRRADAARRGRRGSGRAAVPCPGRSQRRRPLGGRSQRDPGRGGDAEIPGDTVSLAMQDGERTLLVDERPAWESIPALEQHGAAVHADFVVERRAARRQPVGSRGKPFVNARRPRQGRAPCLRYPRSVARTSATSRNSCASAKAGDSSDWASRRPTSARWRRSSRAPISRRRRPSSASGSRTARRPRASSSRRMQPSVRRSSGRWACGSSTSR